ncbi:MAG: ABC transporter ATP-binding protein [Castellaniella sp.]
MSIASAAIAGAPQALELQAVSCSFGALKAVDEVSLSVPRGRRHVIIGPNGAGKSTLFALVSGEQGLSSGRVLLNGEDVSSWSATRRAQSGLSRTYQITNVLLGLTVEENLLLALRGKHASKYRLFASARPAQDENERIDALLSLCSLSAFRHYTVSTMAYGQQRQLELAIALASDPRVLLLDEPAAGLSPAERGPMADIIRGLPRELTVLLIEHDMGLALALAERVTVLHFGRVLVEGTPDEVRNNQEVQDIYFGTADHHA